MDESFGAYFRYMDTLWQAGLARLTRGLSPAGVCDAFYSWATHLAQAPGKMMELATYPAFHAPGLLYRLTCERGESFAADPRFRSKKWDALPWRFYAETFLLMEDWWKKATMDISGLDERDERIVSFAVRQVMDALCPANFPATNPDLAFDTFRSGGQNLLRGAWNAYQDAQSLLSGNGSSEHKQFKVGKNLAVTPGEVVFRNDLIELIRYAPQTKAVYKEPVVILPAWIMKYYILDLSPENSMVRWLVAKGHTVFIVSWKNPTEKDRDLGMDDYYRHGAMASIDVVARAFPKTKLHLTGYCLGGTLALITAAAMARDKDDRLKSLTLFAAEGDFTEAGELKLFVTYSEVAFLKNMMAVQGYLDARQMGGTFQMLRSYDRIWSKIINDYMEGKRRDMFDLTAWNADATRMPSRMHGEYLDKLFLHNDFAEGRFMVEGTAVAPENIRVPVFAVGAEKDHVAPWRSVHKIQLMVNGNVTFVLTAGGHNAGIVSEPGHPNRFYHIHERKVGDPYADPDHWLAVSKREEGSWWEAWQIWLKRHSAKDQIASPPLKKGLGAAPGTYVFQT
jgi:polyhydroxyalkanoate synthase